MAGSSDWITSFRRCATLTASRIGMAVDVAFDGPVIVVDKAVSRWSKS
jgi:hypothetical protein